jgi:aromatic-L-amino-acid decarboxylase
VQPRDDWTLEPDPAAMRHLSLAVLDRLLAFVANLPDRPAIGPQPPDRLIAELLSPPPDLPRPLPDVLDTLASATDHAFETAGPGYLAFIPGGGLVTAALADLYATVTNRYVGIAAPAPGVVALEESMVRWLARDVCGLPEHAGGVLTSGGSMANLSAVVTARHARLGEDFTDGTVYVTAHAHQSLAKACRIAGLRSANVRTVPCDAQLRMDVAAAADLITTDRANGARPFLIVGSAGTTATGTIDPLPEIAELAAQDRLWFHADGAYGAPFRLTERGRARLAGLELADSVTVDPHKTLFLPFGTGALVARDPQALAAAHSLETDVLQDLHTDDVLPDYARLSPELSRDVRGLRMWLPLHLHGVAAFRDALDEKLDLTAQAYHRLAAEPLLELPWSPDLTVIAFRPRPHGTGDAALRAADDICRQLLARINGSGRVMLSSTTVNGRHTLRICVVSHRTHADRVAEAVDLVIAGIRELTPGTPDQDAPAASSSRTTDGLPSGRPAAGWG